MKMVHNNRKCKECRKVETNPTRTTIDISNISFQLFPMLYKFYVFKIKLQVIFPPFSFMVRRNLYKSLSGVLHILNSLLHCRCQRTVWVVHCGHVYKDILSLFICIIPLSLPTNPKRKWFLQQLFYRQENRDFQELGTLFKKSY